MQIKSELRKTLILKRKGIENKEEKDSKIRNILLGSDFYREASQVLFYACIDGEADLDECIADALEKGKKVALPVCKNAFGEMDFYYINSFNDLKLGFFSVREPDTEKCAKVTDFENSLCIVPAVAYDERGYRLGYGKGYYDRFLKNNYSLSVGVCYNELVSSQLPVDKFDVPVKYIITENSIKVCNQENK